MNKKTLNENSILLSKFDNHEYSTIRLEDVEIFYKKQKSWLYYPESLFFPPRLFVIPSIEDLRHYLVSIDPIPITIVLDFFFYKKLVKMTQALSLLQ